jgi:hypothetical protein
MDGSIGRQLTDMLVAALGTSANGRPEGQHYVPS